VPSSGGQLANWLPHHAQVSACTVSYVVVTETWGDDILVVGPVAEPGHTLVVSFVVCEALSFVSCDCVATAHSGYVHGAKYSRVLTILKQLDVTCYTL